MKRFIAIISLLSCASIFIKFVPLSWHDLYSFQVESALSQWVLGMMTNALRMTSLHGTKIESLPGIYNVLMCIPFYIKIILYLLSTVAILGVSCCGLSWISCFGMRMMQQLFLPLTQLLCWNTGLYFMTQKVHHCRTRAGVVQMVILFMMLNIHAGIKESFALQLNSQFFIVSVI